MGFQDFLIHLWSVYSAIATYICKRGTVGLQVYQYNHWCKKFSLLRALISANGRRYSDLYIDLFPSIDDLVDNITNHPHPTSESIQSEHVIKP